MNPARWLGPMAAVVLFATPLMASDYGFFRSRDPLTPRDSWGELHRSPVILPTDLEPRESWRLFYYSKTRRVLARDPAYVGALQEGLQRFGYYCGPIDGIFSDDVVDAIMRLQKNYSMRVTGSITVPVRRALHLP